MNIVDFTSQLCEHCGLLPDQIKISQEKVDGRILIQLDIPEEESGLFIGRRGETLASLQRIVRIVFYEEAGEDVRIELNINDYREKRIVKLEEMVREAAQRVLETGNPYTFQIHLPSHERFMIHTTVSENPEFAELESVSTGRGKDRKLTIQPKQGK